MAVKTLVCCAQPFGYGPAAKLILLASALRERGFRLTLLGNGIALELAARSSVFDEIVDAEAKDRRARLIVQDGGGLLSVMDREYSALALESSRPVYIADSLAWMRERIPAPFGHARRYWVQRFADLGRRKGVLPSNAVVVGPIVQSGTVPSARQSNLVVNLGGGESPHGSLAEKTAYVDFVVNGIIESPSPFLESRFPGGIKLIAGSRCVDYLRSRYAGTGVSFCSVSHREAEQLFATAASVLTSPGLTTSLECFQLGVPTFFLPPQNYSQWRILKTFRQNGLAPGSLHWEELTHDEPSPDEAAETERTPLIGRIIKRCTAEPAASRLFRENLQRGLGVPAKELARNQQAYFTGLGDNGVDQIVDELTDLW